MSPVCERMLSVRPSVVPATHPVLNLVVALSGAGAGGNAVTGAVSDIEGAVDVHVHDDADDDDADDDNDDAAGEGKAAERTNSVSGADDDDFDVNDNDAVGVTLRRAHSISGAAGNAEDLVLRIQGPYAQTAFNTNYAGQGFFAMAKTLLKRQWMVQLRNTAFIGPRIGQVCERRRRGVHVMLCVCVCELTFCCCRRHSRAGGIHEPGARHSVLAARGVRESTHLWSTVLLRHFPLLCQPRVSVPKPPATAGCSH